MPKIYYLSDAPNHATVGGAVNCLGSWTCSELHGIGKVQELSSLRAIGTQQSTISIIHMVESWERTAWFGSRHTNILPMVYHDSICAINSLININLVDCWKQNRRRGRQFENFVIYHLRYAHAWCKLSPGLCPSLSHHYCCLFRITLNIECEGSF